MVDGCVCFTINQMFLVLQRAIRMHVDLAYVDALPSRGVYSTWVRPAINLVDMNGRRLAVLARKRTASRQPMRMIRRMLAKTKDIKRRATAAALEQALCTRMSVLRAKAALLAAD